MDNKNIILVKYSLVLKQDGNLVSEVDHILPDLFLSETTKVDPEWEAAPIVSRAIEYLVKQLKILDEDFDKYLGSI